MGVRGRLAADRGTCVAKSAAAGPLTHDLPPTRSPLLAVAPIHPILTRTPIYLNPRNLQLGPKDSFTLIASYGITVNLVVAVFSPTLGALIDKTNRLSAVIIVTVAQNVCVIACAVCFLLLLYTGIGTSTGAEDRSEKA